MNYCTKGQLVAIMTTGQIGIVDCIMRRRTFDKDGQILVQCGASGPFVKAMMNECRETSENEYKEWAGLR